MQSSSTANWSELPKDLLEHLTSLLSLPDYHRFSAVCRNWFAVAQQKHYRPRQLPWLVLGEDNVTHKHEFFSLSENKHYFIDIPELQGHHLCGSSYGWLFSLDTELNFRMLNPFTRECYDMPPLPPYNRYFNIKTYVKVRQSDEDTTFADMQFLLVGKAILDRDPSRSSEFRVLIIYGKDLKLACWRFGDSAWTLLKGSEYNFFDIIFFKENFYAVRASDECDEIYLVDDGPKPKLKRVEPKIPAQETYVYLVEYMGELLLVYRLVNLCFKQVLMTYKIMVHRIDLEQETCSIFKPVNGHALSVFMGVNSSVTVDPTRFPECKRNALYLTDIPGYFSEEFGCKDFCLYDMVEGSFARYYDPAERFISSFNAPIWMTPNPW